MVNKNRLIYDLCTPAADRRPTTPGDLEEDIWVVNFDTPEELITTLGGLAGFQQWDWDDLVDEIGTTDPTRETAAYILKYLDDPGDGSPNVLYCAIDGKVCDEAMPYDCLTDLNLDNCTERDVIEAVSEELAGDWDEEDLEEEDAEIEESWSFERAIRELEDVE